jgi:hypothetical protein
LELYFALLFIDLPGKSWKCGLDPNFLGATGSHRRAHPGFTLQLSAEGDRYSAHIFFRCATIFPTNIPYGGYR